jgi:hypothetical protein
MENKLSKIAHGSRVNYRKIVSICTAVAFSLLMTISGCQKSDTEMAPDDNTNVGSDAAARRFHPNNTNFNEVNLVSDVTGFNANLTNLNLVNAWGIAFGPTGGIWVSSNGPGVSVIYDQNGNTLRPPVTIPFGTDSANPTGQVFNATATFVIPSTGQVSKFIFATENGTIAAWASGNAAITIADRSSQGPVYKGIEMDKNGHSWVLYATDFHNGKLMCLTIILLLSETIDLLIVTFLKASLLLISNKSV